MSIRRKSQKIGLTVASFLQTTRSLSRDGIRGHSLSDPFAVDFNNMQVSVITTHGLRAPLSCMAFLRNLAHAGSAQNARSFRRVKNKPKENTGHRNEEYSSHLGQNHNGADELAQKHKQEQEQKQKHNTKAGATYVSREEC